MGLSPAPRLGVYGGAFDPPHHAHVELACAAVQQLRLDRLLVVPTGDAWHKARGLSSAADRLAMCQLAFDDLPGVRVDARELHREGASYTVDTLQELATEQAGASLFLLIGADQAAVFSHWHRPADILTLASLIIAARGGLADDAWDPADALPGVPFDPARVHLLRLPAMPHSASQVRRLARDGGAYAHLVPAAVARYIDTHHLYQQGT